MLTAHPEVISLLDEELVGWLTTVNEAGQPQASPVWHVIDGEYLIVFSRPNARRLRNIERNPRVAYNLRGDFQGDTVVTLEGIASVDPALGTPLGNREYLDKYVDEMARLGWTPEEYDAEFSVPLRIEITRVRAEIP